MRAGGDREIDGGRLPNHVGVPLRVRRHVPSVFCGAPAQVGGVDQHRVDDQWPGAVVGAEAEAEAREQGSKGARELRSGAPLLPCPPAPLPPCRPHQAVVCGDRPPLAAHQLIGHRLPLAEGAGGGAEEEIPVGGQLRAARAGEGEADLPWIGAGGDFEVVFEAAFLVAVVDGVDAGVDLLVADPGVLGDVVPPLLRVAPDEVIALAGERRLAGDAGAGVGVEEAEFHR